MSDYNVSLGDRAKDEISGMEGVVVTVADHLSGCRRVGMYPDDIDDTTRRGDEEYFDDVQLETVEENRVALESEPITETEISLGDVVEDDVTGFEGVVIVHNYQLYNVPQVCVQPTTDSGEKPDTEWFDVSRVNVVEEGVFGEYNEEFEDADSSETGSVEKSVHRKSIKG